MKSYLAELRSKVTKNERKFLHIIHDFMSEQVCTTNEEAPLVLTSKFHDADYSEYKLQLPERGEFGRVNRDSWSVFDRAALNSSKYPYFGPTAKSLRSEFSILEQRPLRAY